MAPVTVPSQPKDAPIVSVEIHNNPIWNPPTDYTNPYTGEVTYSFPGYYSLNGVIEITVKNRSFTPHTDTNHIYNIYYCVFHKLDTHSWSTVNLPKHVVYQSDSAYTVITITYDEKELSFPDHLYIAQEDTVFDFRIQAVEGYFNLGTPPNYFDAVFEGEGSAFTEFTVAIPARDKPGTSKPIIQPTSVAPSTNAPNNPQIFQQYYIVIIVTSACIIVVLIAIIIYQNKQGKTNPYPNPTHDQSLKNS
ncbi:MAG: hypothetical protein FWH37_09965 [Candidatus Bathyarchaeota archaeon]|nr:hypothetical protein [Candidatus Termiticorpusculum sp.]